MAASTKVEGAAIAVAYDDTPLARATTRRVSLRLLPFLFVLYIANFLDRTNVSIAALQMNRDLRFSGRRVRARLRHLLRRLRAVRGAE